MAIVTAIAFSVIIFLKSLDSYSALFDPFDDSFLSFDLYDVYYSKLYNQDGFQDSEIILINIEESNRNEIAVLLDSISNYDPKVIGIDVILKELDKQKDTLLIEQLNSNNEKLVLGFDLTKESNALLDQNRHGYINLVSEDRYTVRAYHPYAYNAQHQYKNAFSEEIFKLYRGTETNQQKKTNEEVKLIDFSRCCVNSKFKKSYTAYLAKDIFISNSWKQKIKNKIVLIGYLSSGPNDILDKYYTPMNPSILGRSKPDMNGLQIHANILSSLIADNRIIKFGRTFLLILSIVLSFFYIKYMLYLKEARPNQWELIFRILNFTLVIALFAIALTLFHLFRFRIEIDIFLIPILLLKEVYSFLFSELRNIFKLTQ